MAQQNVFWLLTLSVTFLPRKYQNPFTYVKVIASRSGTFFETWCSNVPRGANVLIKYVTEAESLVSYTVFTAAQPLSTIFQAISY